MHMIQAKRGLGMWVMSKTVLMVFLLGLVVVLTGVLSIYQERVIEDNARAVIMLWAESANSVVMFPSGSIILPIENKIMISGGTGKSTQIRSYTAGITHQGSPSSERIVFLLTWETGQPAEDAYANDEINDIEQFVAAVALELPSQPPDDIRKVHMFKGRLTSTNIPTYPLFLDTVDKDLVLRPSIDGSKRDDGLLFYRDGPVLCIASKKKLDTNAKESMDRLIECCFLDPADIPIDCK